MTQAGMRERRLGSVGEMTPERLAELWRIAEAGPAGDWDMIELEHSTVLALLDEIERLRQAVDALQLDRRTLEDVISVLEQEQRRAGRYLEDARDELAHGRIQSAEHRIIDALVSLSSKERRTDTRLKTAVKSGGGCD